MKKLVCFVLTLVALLCCLTACNLGENMADAIADKAEATPKAEEMVTALAEGNTQKARSLLHTRVTETSDAAIAQMVSFLAGRKANATELISVNISTSAGTSGTARQEKLGYKITLSDDTVIYLNAVYLSDNEGTGFTSFQLVLGVV